MDQQHRTSSYGYSRERVPESSRSSTSHLDRGAAGSHYTRPPPNWRTRDDGPGGGRYGHPYPSRTAGRDWRSRQDGPSFPSASSSGSTSHPPIKGVRTWASSVSDTSRKGVGAHQTRDRRDTGQVNWKEVEAKAKQKGFAVPSDIVEEFKRQGHYDVLRRQLLVAFQNSTQRQELQSSVSTLLLSYFQASPHEAARMGRLEDRRLQESECLKILEMDRLPKETRRGGSGPAAPPPMTGPDIFAGLVKQLLDVSGVAQSAGESTGKGVGADPSTDISGILCPHGSVGKAVRDRVETLLREEIREKDKLVAPESTGETVTAPTVESGTAAAAVPIGGTLSPRDHEEKADETMQDTSTEEVMGQRRTGIQGDAGVDANPVS